MASRVALGAAVIPSISIDPVIAGTVWVGLASKTIELYKMRYVPLTKVGDAERVVPSTVIYMLACEPGRVSKTRPHQELHFCEKRRSTLPMTKPFSLTSA